MLALWPTDTIVVTAAMPITTPSTVSPARILFLASARTAMRTVTGEIMVFREGCLPGAGWRGLKADHKDVSAFDGSRCNFRVLAVGQSGLHLDGPQQVSVGHPDVVARPFLAEPCPFGDREGLQRDACITVLVGFCFLFPLQIAAS